MLGSDKNKCRKKFMKRSVFAVLVLILILLIGTACADEYQPAFWFMDDLKITQVPGGDYSHAGTLNFDVVGVRNRNIKAPFDAKIVAIHKGEASGNTVVIQSLNPVLYANGTVAYMSLGFGHDNDISDCYVGRVLSQGEVFCQNGDYGNATGIHSHVIVVGGKYTDNPGFKQVSTGRWTFANAIRPETALFIRSSTNVVDARGINFVMYQENTYLDVNGYLDGVDSGNLGSYGTFDITAGSSSLNDVNDYYTSHPRGTAYNITDIKANPGYDYLGVISGNLSGTISGSNTVNIRLSFATQGNLTITGLLDGSNKSSTLDYGTFDVYINGNCDETNCTSYNKHWPNGTTYEIRNIQAASGKHFTGQASYSGTITSRTESKVILPYDSDGFATTEWQTGTAVPANLDPLLLDIEFDNHYETVSSTSPGAGWVRGSVVSSEYVNSGAPYSSHVVLPTSETRVLVSYYYYHWCHSANNNANYEPTSTYYHYDQILDPSLVYVNNTLIDRLDSSYVIYNLKWKSTGGWAYCKSGTTCDGNYGTHGNRSYHWYRMDTYQDRVLVQTFNWAMDSGWTDTRNPNAASVKVRYRLKNGIALTGNDITAITAPDSLSLMAGETAHVDVDVYPMFVGISTDELTFTIEDGNLFGIDDDHNIFCKDTYGTTSDTNLIISAPNGVTKTVSLTARTNVRNYSYLINNLPACSEPNTVDIYKVGQVVPYQVSYDLFNDYDPGYGLVPAEGETGYTTDTSTGTLTFQAPTNPSGMSVVLTLPESGYFIEYGNLLVTDDQKSMYLPSRLVQIEEEAFEGSNAKYFFLPGSVQSIGSNAFPAGSCVFLNTANLTNFSFADNGVWFVETGSGYNEAFAALHSNYLVPRGLTSPSAGEE